MASRKFVSISAAGDGEDGYTLIAVADDGTAWVSDMLPVVNMASVEELQWYPVSGLPEPERKATNWKGYVE